MDVDRDLCEKCNCSPCQCKRLARAKKHGATHCVICGQELGIKGGMAATDMCGPCCTGEAETLNEKGETW